MSSRNAIAFYMYWYGKRVNVTYTAWTEDEEGKDVGHFEFRCRWTLPISESGYHSLFDLMAVGLDKAGAIRYVENFFADMQKARFKPRPVPGRPSGGDQMALFPED